MRDNSAALWTNAESWRDVGCGGMESVQIGSTFVVSEPDGNAWCKVVLFTERAGSRAIAAICPWRNHQSRDGTRHHFGYSSVRLLAPPDCHRGHHGRSSCGLPGAARLDTT